jgi:hypothetical protein
MVEDPLMLPAGEPTLDMVLRRVKECSRLIGYGLPPKAASGKLTSSINECGGDPFEETTEEARECCGG